MRAAAALGVLVAGAVATACADGGGHAAERTGAAASAIVNGTVDTTRPDVLLMGDDTLPGFRCTATLIAPNLVVTARHCVARRGIGTALCRGDGTDTGAGSLPLYDGDADPQPMTFSSGPGAPVLARGKAIHDDGATTTCGHDLALVELDTPITGITPATLRRTAVSVGDPLVVMGFGWTDRNATVNATQRMKGSTLVLAAGPTVFTYPPNGNPSATPVPLAVAAGEIGVSGVTMTGDSGGPSFDGDGKLASVTSRGFNDALYGPATFTTIAAHLPVIDMALAATGNAPAAPPDAGPPGPDGGAGPVVPGGSLADAGAAAGDGSATAGEGDEASSSGCAVSVHAARTRWADPTPIAAAVASLALVIARRSRRSRRG